MPKPALGRVAIGDRLLVIPAGYGRGARGPIDVTVAKVGRVWVELSEVDEVRSFAKTWRLRLDTQDSASGYSHTDRFVTADQLAWEQRENAVDAYLREVSVRPDRDSPWGTPERRIILANLLRAHDGLPEL